MKKYWMFLALCTALFSCVGLQSVAFAEIIKLKTGHVIDGVIVEKDEAGIKIKKDGEIKEFSSSDIKYIRGEGLDPSSSEYYGLLMDAMNEPDTNLEGWETTGTYTISLQDTPAVKAFDKAKQLFNQGQRDECYERSYKRSQPILYKFHKSIRKI